MIQLSDLDLIKNAEEEPVAVAGASITLLDLKKLPPPLPVVASKEFKSAEQPKSQALEDDSAKSFQERSCNEHEKKADDPKLLLQKSLDENSDVHGNLPRITNTIIDFVKKGLRKITWFK